MKSALLVPASVFILVLGGSIVRLITNQPPETEVKQAGNMLAAAQMERSPAFAEEAFDEASRCYDSAMLAWNAQNEKFILLRNYKKVHEYAQKSIRNSEKAIRTTRTAISNTEGFLESRLSQLRDRLDIFEKSFGRFPLDQEHRDAFARSKLLLTEGLHAFQSKNYTVCESRLDSVEAAFTRVSSYYNERLVEYLDAYPQWKQMVEQSILYSKKNQTYVIVVDKMARDLMVYKSGELQVRYPVELGSNWVGDKMQQGDKSTPEGIYKILEKKQNGQTRYHKAFLLDYPNAEDQKRFARNKKSGLIRHDASIGNLIEIHGGGGKGTDWTDGCVALQDKHMDELFAICLTGTRVTIVGSTKPLKNLSYRQQ